MKKLLLMPAICFICSFGYAQGIGSTRAQLFDSIAVKNIQYIGSVHLDYWGGAIGVICSELTGIWTYYLKDGLVVAMLIEPKPEYEAVIEGLMFYQGTPTNDPYVRTLYTLGGGIKLMSKLNISSTQPRVFVYYTADK